MFEEQTLEQFIFEIIDELETADTNLTYERATDAQEVAALKEYYVQMRAKARRLLEEENKSKKG